MPSSDSGFTNTLRNTRKVFGDVVADQAGSWEFTYLDDDGTLHSSAQGGRRCQVGGQPAFTLHRRTTLPAPVTLTFAELSAGSFVSCGECFFSFEPFGVKTDARVRELDMLLELHTQVKAVRSAEANSSKSLVARKRKLGRHVDAVTNLRARMTTPALSPELFDTLLTEADTLLTDTVPVSVTDNLWVAQLAQIGIRRHVERTLEVVIVATWRGASNDAATLRSTFVVDGHENIIAGPVELVAWAARIGMDHTKSNHIDVVSLAEVAADDRPFVVSAIARLHTKGADLRELLDVATQLTMSPHS